MNAYQDFDRVAGRIAGIDFGTVRLGIAVSDPEQSLASPLDSHIRRSPEQDAEYLNRLAAREGITRWVIGLPVHLDGRESEKSRQAREFGEWLGEATGIEVEFFDERFTSREADELLQQAKMTPQRRKRRVDMLAAQIMLAAYLESETRGTAPPGPLDD